jgi:hypothetical protein
LCGVTDTLTPGGRVARVGGTVAVAVLVLAGTLFGQDNDFPFGPFRMYSTAPHPDRSSPDTRVEGVDASGRTVVMSEANSGIRRAEIEGRQQQYVADPTRLRQVAAAYAARNPTAPALVEVRIVIRWQGIKDSRPTGVSTDEVVVRWVGP